jgi:zinc D-Ala-D-Ala dipeptidase
MLQRVYRMQYLLAALIALSAPAARAQEAAPPLVDVASLHASIGLEIRYATADTFTGAFVDAYGAPRCLLSEPAARALGAAQQEFAAFGLSLLVYDCFRPQRAVDHFMRWTRDAAGEPTKARYYPRVPRSNLVEEGYIAARSGHSRASTVDLTLRWSDGRLLEMGTPWDFFDPLARTEAAGVPAAARANRLLLRAVMEKHGFRNYPAEWWHFTLDGEPWPERYFDRDLRPEDDPPG